MVKIRLQRTGRRNHAQWRMVATDQRKKRDGKCIEILGWYDPHRDDSEKINVERYDYWVSKGAQASDVSRQIVNRFRKQAEMAPVVAAEASVKTETSVKASTAEAPKTENPAAEEASVKTETSVKASTAEAPKTENPAAEEASVKTEENTEA